MITKVDEIDPVTFVAELWPDIKLYDKQAEIMYSVQENDDTIVVAGNALGKDFIAGLIVLWFFCSRRPARVVTTSVQFEQLNDVLWGEIRNFISTAKYQLPIHYNHMKIRQTYNSGRLVDKSEIVAQVPNTAEGILGRHLPRGPNRQPRTLLVGDEVSGMDDNIWEKTETWAQRRLAIGNPFDCENFFKRAYEEGDILRVPGKPEYGYYRKVITICAEDSPNVKFARREIAEGKKPSNTVIIPGVKEWDVYQKQRQLWDAKLQSIGLDAKFYEGADVKLYPPEWLKESMKYAKENPATRKRKGRSIGIDVAEGGDSSVWTVVDEIGILEQRSEKTPDTSVIPDITIELGNKWGVPPEMWWFDRGGGGKQHADLLRRKGYKVRTVGFGEAATDPHKNRTKVVGTTKKENREEIRYVFKNRRAEMFGLIRYEFLDPIGQFYPFGIPEELTELRRQLSKFPIDYEEGKLVLPPKNRLSEAQKRRGTKNTLVDLIGHSPDEADSFALAMFGMFKQKRVRKIGGGL